MAVKYVQEKSSSGLGNLLGGLATIGVALTGQPWLSALGTGIGALNNMANGSASVEDYGALGNSAKEILSGISKWVNPAQGSITGEDVARVNNWNKALTLGNVNPYTIRSNNA